jgi:hypothetical protein
MLRKRIFVKLIKTLTYRNAAFKNLEGQLGKIPGICRIM